MVPRLGSVSRTAGPTSEAPGGGSWTAVDVVAEALHPHFARQRREQPVGVNRDHRPCRNLEDRRTVRA
jgi:hypothetical protein